MEQIFTIAIVLITLVCIVICAVKEEHPEAPEAVTAEDLLKRYKMVPHEENGSFSETHYPYSDDGRAASGSIYYYVGAEERTMFHRIDCDEYWCYVKGAPLEVWLADGEGAVTVSKLGVEEGCEPLLYVPRGMTFAARHSKDGREGTFLSCITVPRFQYEGSTLLTQEEAVEQFPALQAFYQ